MTLKRSAFVLVLLSVLGASGAPIKVDEGRALELKHGVVHSMEMAQDLSAFLNQPETRGEIMRVVNGLIPENVDLSSVQAEAQEDFEIPTGCWFGHCTSVTGRVKATAHLQRLDGLAGSVVLNELAITGSQLDGETLVVSVSMVAAASAAASGGAEAGIVLDGITDRSITGDARIAVRRQRCP